MYVCVLVCVCNHRCQKSVSDVSSIAIIFFKRLDLEFPVSSRLADQRALRIHLPPHHAVLKIQLASMCVLGSLESIGHYPKYLVICNLVLSLIHWLLRNIFNFYVMVSFLFFLLIISTRILLWLENILYTVSLLFKLIKANFMTYLPSVLS